MMETITKRHTLTQALAALLALAGVVTALISLSAYSVAGRGEMLADYAATSVHLAECPAVSSRQSEPAQDAQDALRSPESDQNAAQTPLEGEFITETTKRDARAHRGICEGDVIVGELTHYCAGTCCNDQWDGITADGTALNKDTPPIVGCNWLPLDAVVEFGGRRYRVADRGGKEFDAVGRLDVYVAEGHQAALGKGRVSEVEIKIISLPGGNES